MLRSLKKLQSTLKIKYKPILFISILIPIFEVLGYGLLGKVLKNIDQQKTLLEFKLLEINSFSLDLDTILITLISLFFLKCFFQVINLKLITNISLDAKYLLTKKLMKSYLDFREFFLEKKGNLINSVTIESARAGNSLKFGFDIVEKITSILILLVFLIFFNWKYTIILLLLIFFIFILTKKHIKKFSQNVGENNLKLSREYTSKVSEIINSIFEIKIWEIDKRVLSEQNLISKNYAEMLKKFRFYPAIINPIVELMIITIIFSCIFVIYKLNIFSSNLFSELAVIFIVSSRLFQYSSRIISCNMKLRMLIPSVDFVLKELDKINLFNNDYEIDGIRKKNRNEIDKINEIKIENLNFAHDEKIIFKKVNLKFKKNEIAIIAGESGSGKTTLLNIISGILNNYEGSVFVNGENLKKFYQQSYRSNLAYGSQAPYIFHDTIYNNIVLNNDNADKKFFDNVLKQSQIYNLVNEMKNKENTIMVEGGKNLSLGQVQRLGIARVLYKNVDVCIFDECTSALDKENEKKIIKNIHKLKKDKIIIIVTHNPDFFGIADKIYRINDGSISLENKN